MLGWRLSEETGRVRSIQFRMTILIAATVAVAACGRSEQRKPSQGNEVAAAQPELGKGVDRSHKGMPAPDASFVNEDGEQTSIMEIGGGKPLLVNLWASWCGPCVKELPTLDRLSQLPKAPVQVAAISQDNGPHASVEAFLTSHKVANLEPYQDKDMALSGALNAQVLPTSVLFDGKGREVWRYVGDLDWTSPEAAKLLSEARS
jgi:thiol-disulfide isomerase/thioredoxin